MNSLKPTAFLVIVSLAISSSGSAVSLALMTDENVYSVGESIVVTLLGDTAGAGNDNAVRVDVGYDDTLVIEPTMASQTSITSFGGFVTWSPGSPPCGPSACVVFNQVAGSQPITPDPDIEVGTLVLTAVSPGVLVLTTGVLQPVDWFQAPPPPDVTVTIVPEPGTLGLLGLGLLGLARAVRRRR